MSCYGYSHEEIASLIGHRVSVTLSQQKTVEGFLYTIDPATTNVIVYNVEDRKVRVFMSHVIHSLSIDKNNKIDIDNEIMPFVNQIFTKDWINSRRVALIEFFKKNHIPVEHGDKNKEQKDKNNIDNSTNDGKENDQFKDSGDDACDNEDDEPVIYVLGCARVVSPYLATNVVCDNPLIRKRVRDFILELPPAPPK